MLYDISQLSEPQKKLLVQAFQEKHGLEPDGLIGKDTMGKLISLTSSVFMTTSPAGIDFIVKEEGIVLKPYRDAVGVATIGIGSTYYENGNSVKMSDPPITRERAIQLFKNTLKTYEKAVRESVKSSINQNQFDALVSFTYNCGAGALKKSSLLKLVNANPKDPAITEAFKMWRYAGKNPILLNRRIREAKLYFS